MPQNHLLLSLPDAQACQQLRHLLQLHAPGCQIIESAADCQQQPLCRWLQPLPTCSLGEVQSSLDDAVSVLERSRHAFKSAQLAGLRKRLQHLMEELSAADNYGTS